MNSEEILRKEFENLKQNPLSELGYTIELFNQNNIYEWKIILIGAKDTPYSDGIFIVKLQFPKKFPYERPRIFFLTPFFHMNVHRSSGNVAVNFIENWNTNSNVRQILTKLYSIFYLINPKNSYNEEPFSLYKENKELYYLKAVFYTKKYAILDSFEDFKSYYGKRNFSFSLDQKSGEKYKKINNNEFFNIYFNLNGEQVICFTCNSNMTSKELIHEIQNKLRISLYEPLFIYEGRRLDEQLTLGENGLKNKSHVTIIHDVRY